MTSKQRAQLRKLTNGLDAIVQVGKNNLTPEITKSIDEALEARELVKIGILQSSDEEPREMADTLAGRTHSEVVSVVGRKIVLYRKSKKSPKIEL